MPRLYLIRHGKTIFNEERRYQGGGCDSDLTATGIAQAEETAEKLKELSFDKCYSSPLGRVQRTTEIILKNHNTANELNDSLKELNFGKWEGIKFDKEFAPEPMYREFWENPETFTGENSGGENCTDLMNRIYTGIEAICKKHQDSEKLLIVSHGGAINAFLNVCLGIPLEKFWVLPRIKQASITIVDWNKGESPIVVQIAGTPLKEIEYL